MACNPSARSCPICGGPLPPSQRPWSPRRYCSTPCRHKGYRRQKPKPPRSTTCRHCAAPLTQHRHGGGPKLYCSTSCCAKAGYWRRRPARPTVCQRCGEPMAAVTLRKQFCSDACRHAARRARAKLPKPPSAREALVLAVGWPGVSKAA